MFKVICPNCDEIFELDDSCINYVNDYNGRYCDVTCPICDYEEDVSEKII